MSSTTVPKAVLSSSLSSLMEKPRSTLERSVLGLMYHVLVSVARRASKSFDTAAIRNLPSSLAQGSS